MKNYIEINKPDFIQEIIEIGKIVVADPPKKYIIEPWGWRATVWRPAEDHWEYYNKADALMKKYPWSDYVSKVSVYWMKPDKKQMRVHRDRDRRSAINLPVIIPEDSWLGVSDYQLNNEIDKSVRTPDEQGLSAQKVEDLGHKFDMQNGVIINVSAWHWVKNNSNKQRAIISMDIKDNYSYEDTIKYFKHYNWL